jgi:hypothetical protein
MSTGPPHEVHRVMPVTVLCTHWPPTPPHACRQAATSCVEFTYEVTTGCVLLLLFVLGELSDDDDGR